MSADTWSPAEYAGTRTDYTLDVFVATSVHSAVVAVCGLSYSNCYSQVSTLPMECKRRPNIGYAGVIDEVRGAILFGPCWILFGSVRLSRRPGLAFPDRCIRCNGRAYLHFRQRREMRIGHMKSKRREYDIQRLTTAKRLFLRFRFLLFLLFLLLLLLLGGLREAMICQSSFYMPDQLYLPRPPPS
jgi:hypothetical protein